MTFIRSQLKDIENSDICMKNLLNWIYPKSFSKIGQELGDVRTFEDNSNLTLFSWPGDLALDYIIFLAEAHSP